jgi:hypothetical protein
MGFGLTSLLGMLYLAMARAAVANTADRRAPAAARAVPELLARADEHATKSTPAPTTLAPSFRLLRTSNASE